MIRKARMVSKTSAKVSTQLLNGRWRIERRFDRAWIAQLHWTNTTLEKEILVRWSPVWLLLHLKRKPA